MGVPETTLRPSFILEPLDHYCIGFMSIYANTELIIFIPHIAPQKKVLLEYHAIDESSIFSPARVATAKHITSSQPSTVNSHFLPELLRSVESLLN